MIYAVNKRTKEHRVCLPERSDNLLRDAFVFTADEKLIQATPDGWIEWQEGSGSPLPEDTRCDVMLWGRKVVPNVIAHSNASWEGVTHYRPILDVDTKPEPAWDGEGLPPVGCECECTFAVEDHDTWHRGVVTLRGVAPEGHEIVAIKVGDITAVYRSAKHIRPIRSEEDRAVEAIEAAYRKGCGVNSEGSFTSIYAAIRDGKIPGVRLDD